MTVKSILKHVQAILLLPGMGLIVVPALILRSAPHAEFSFNFLCALRVLAGIIFIGAGLTLMVKAVRLFATVGAGTLAPWTPTRRLIGRGVYRYVRNPMMTGAFSVLFGETLVFGSTGLFFWFLILVAANLVYIPLVEETGLEKRFGEDYREYKRNVPRWIPGMSPWEPATSRANAESDAEKDP
jgi:protein-S-isoprenylcysteine O-methyltransferase Ste14